MVQTSQEITSLLRAWRDGDKEAEDELIAVLYPHLKKLAQREVSKWSRKALQPTEIVHELYLRWGNGGQPDWQDRTHFFAVASRAIRGILVDQARRATTQKRGRGTIHVHLDATELPTEDPEFGILELDQALWRLAEVDAAAARLVELRFFGGLEVHEAAESLETSVATAVRKWRMARAWLRREMSVGAPP